MPRGTWTSQTQWIASGRLFGGEAGQWILAGPDGSLHFLADDFQPVDQFQYGEQVTGLGIARLDNAGALLIATEKGVSAWRVARKGDE